MGKKRLFQLLLIMFFIALVTDNINAQETTKGENIVISGKVNYSNGEPLIGATIRIVGTKIGTSVDENGHYELHVKRSNHMQVICSFIGCKSVTENVRKDGTVQLIVMNDDDTHTTEEVVVTGYQQIDKRNLTSSVTSVNMNQIDRPGVSSLDKMLQGRIPDLVVTNSSSEVNAVPKIRIRGTSTLIGNREPLWVVDGIIVSDPVNLSADVINDPDYVNRIGNAISGINPQDIDRIDVLKDAAATALYGTRAANGVIVVTTKKGRAGKPVISYNFNGTYRRRPRYSDRKINLMNSQERTDISKYLVGMHYSYPNDMTYIGYEDAVNKYYNGTYSQDQFNTAVAKSETQNTDWFKLLTKDSFSADHSANISGGSDKFRYYASLGYTDDNDVINNNTNQRYTASTNLDFTITEKVKASMQLNVYHTNKQYDQDNLSPIDYAYRTSRVLPAYNDDGSYFFYNKIASGIQGIMSFNILNELDNSYKKQIENGMKATVNLRYNPTDWLFFNGIMSYNTTNTNIEGWYGEKSWYAGNLRKTSLGVEPNEDSQMPFGGELSNNNIGQNNWTARIQGNVNKYFGSDLQHNINLAVGFEANSTHYNGDQYTQRGYYLDRGKKFVTSIPDKYKTYLSWLGTNVPIITDSKTNLLSVYGTLSYSYKQYFTVNANTRYDGSNKFGDRSNEKILPVWSTSGVANIKEIAHIKLNWLDAINWKISYGEQGNMLDGQSPVLTLTKGSYDTHYSEMTSTTASNANPDLKWEKTHSFSTGFETSLFKNRLMLELEYYYKKTTDAFMNKTISDINGYTSYIVNSGEIINKGYNFSITAIPIQNKDWNWLVSASLSKVINKMKTSPGEDSYSLNDYLNGTAVINGQSLGTFYSYRFIGLNPEDGGPLFDDYQDRSNELLGLSKYETFMRVLSKSGKRDPDITGSISSTLSYKNFRLGILMDYAMGNKVRLFKVFGQGATMYQSGPGNIYPEYNLNRTLLDRWIKPGDEARTNIPSIMSKTSLNYYKYDQHWSSGNQYQGVQIATDSYTMYDYSDIRVISADYIRLASLSLTYELSEKLLPKLGLQRLSITAAGNNLYTLCNSKLKGQTPTQSGFSDVQLSDNPYYTISINVQF
ncbi:SusC/RagA family TonB-linked outer membrane protein [Prevotella herbatica]|nr:SusC/RagA family TonB-linked outer membrane protein [Prevotella herbatica]